ncbi:MAG TPA: chromate resistance protein ChrB domain-containing protein [Thermoanaerobaculia bacterium]|nr:chromate resistance protein ChrB domain-containing protein [Thermoanaerobaculia bacterium]
MPPKPLYLRARIRQRLARVGAIALKNSVYVLPHSEVSLEDFQWIAEEAVAGGGEAFLCEADFFGRPSGEEIEARFRRERAADYDRLATEARELLRLTSRRGAAVASEADLALRFSRLQKRLGEVAAIDFFAAPEREKVEALLGQVAVRLRAGQAPAPAASQPAEHAGLAGRTWVTRKGIHIDRIASAWLVRRFVDPAARFRFVDSQTPEAAPGEIRFDTVGGDFTHEGDRCTFETLVARLGLADPALAQIAEIVHDIDLKDGRYGRPDAAGISQLLTGLVLAHPDDFERLDRGFALLDDLYGSFRPAGSAGNGGSAGRPAGSAGDLPGVSPMAGAATNGGSAGRPAGSAGKGPGASDQTAGRKRLPRSASPAVRAARRGR